MENSKFITSWQEVHTIVDDAMAKGDRSVYHLYFAGWWNVRLSFPLARRGNTSGSLRAGQNLIQ